MEDIRSIAVADQYLTSRQVAALLNITLPTLHKLTHNGSIKGFKVGARIRYRLNDVQNSLKEIAQPEKPSEA